ncbi:DDE-type integrase/transposase/recombinase [Acholeplasma sp. OttesenSCG-928-E16]|nr:DDE-type integrase/transposase/recombinase [Acholeplasma sp. OttesenSCG-928-E16]
MVLELILPKPPKNVPKLYDPTTFPGQRIQIDVKFVLSSCIIDNPHNHKYYQYTAIDEFTRFRVLKIYKEHSTYSSKLFIDFCIKRFPFDIKCIQTDNGPEFTNKYLSADPKPSLFEATLMSLGISHKLIKPYTPRHNGKVERSHRKDKNLFYTRKFLDENDLRVQLRNYVREYNNFPMRPLGWLSPLEYLKKYNIGELHI